MVSEEARVLVVEDVLQTQDGNSGVSGQALSTTPKVQGLLRVRPPSSGDPSQESLGFGHSLAISYSNLQLHPLWRRKDSIKVKLLQATSLS